jgi:hypothetical protein
VWGGSGRILRERSPSPESHDQQGRRYDAHISFPWLFPPGLTTDESTVSFRFVPSVLCATNMAGRLLGDSSCERSLDDKKLVSQQPS